MEIINQTKNFYIKELKLLFRNKGSYGGVLLFLISSVFVVYHATGISTNPNILNGIIWILLLFSITTAVTANFSKEDDAINIYNYGIINPIAYIIAKVILNIVISILLALLLLALFYLFFSFIPLNIMQYIIGILAGSIGFSLILTFTSALASRAGGNFTLVAVLSFPLVFPVIIIANKITLSALSISETFNFNFLLQSSLLNILILLLIIVLFPYLWKE